MYMIIMAGGTASLKTNVWVGRSQCPDQMRFHKNLSDLVVTRENLEDGSIALYIQLVVTPERLQYPKIPPERWPSTGTFCRTVFKGKITNGGPRSA